jgi:biopolymer transport protein ExbD
MRPPASTHTGINVTPLIDLIMCLIIFFLVAAQLAGDEQDASVELPRVRRVLVMDPLNLGDRVTVNVVPGGVGEVVRYRVRGHDYALTGVSELLRGSQARNVDVKLVLRCDGRVRFADVQPLMIAAGRAGIKQTVFAAGRAE